MAIPVGELDVPFVGLGPGRGSPQRTRRELAAGVDGEVDHWLFRSELGYLVVAYDDIQAVLRDRRWHSGLTLISPSGDEAFERWRSERVRNILQSDGADHQRLRHAFGSWFTPKQTEELRPLMADVFGRLLDPFIERGGGEFVSEVAEPYPVRVIFALLGAPEHAYDEFRSLTGSINPTELSPALNPEAVMAATSRLDEFATSLIEAGRGAPKPGLLGDLVQAEADGVVSEPELVSLIESVLLGGTDSTRNQLSSAVSLFSRFDDEYQRLRAQPELAPQAVEEVLRYLGAARGTARVANVDIEYRDVLFPAGTVLMLGFTAANRTTAVRHAPNRFDITAAHASPHLSFGHGAHFCIGASLARAELQVALSALADRVRRIDLDGEIEWRPQTADFWGPEVLPIRVVV